MRTRVACLFGSLVTLSACSSILGIDDGTPRDDAGDVADAQEAGSDGASSDAATDHVDAGATCTSATPFKPPVLVAGLDTMTSSTATPFLSTDELSIVFTTNRANPDAGGGAFDLWTASRASRSVAFGSLAPLEGVNGTSNDIDPWMSDDRLTLFFASDRNLVTMRVLEATRPSASSPFTLLGQAFGGGGKVIQQRSPRPTAGLKLMTLASSTSPQPYDLTTASVGDAGLFVSDGVIAELSGSADEIAPVLTSDALEIYFASDRPGSQGLHDVLHASRASATTPWGAPTFVTEVSSVNDDVPGWISPDKCRLYLSVGSVMAGTAQIYVAERKP